MQFPVVKSLVTALLSLRWWWEGAGDRDAEASFLPPLDSKRLCAVGPWYFFLLLKRDGNGLLMERECRGRLFAP